MIAASHPMRYRILGPILLGESGDRLPAAGSRQIALLACLLLNPNRAVTSDRLLAALWGDDRAASKRLQMTVTRLRRGLEPFGGGSALRTIRGGYVLVVAPGELDAEVFERRIDEGCAALESGDPSAAAEILRAALALWRGEPLADVGYMEFAQAEIRRLDELHQRAFEAHIEADLQLGRHRALVGELEAFVSEHPARERAAAQLMLALYRCERQADALDAYRRTWSYLTDELGLEPGSALRRLQAQILAQSRELELSPTPVAPAGVALPAFVARLGGERLLGRAAELDLIDACWSATVKSASHRILLIAGEPGVGKTSLATHFACAAHARGATVLYGRADAEALIPYQPFVEALRHLAQRAPLATLEAAAHDLAELSRLVPDLRRRLPDLPAPLEHSTGDDRYRLFAATAALLVAAAKRSPTLLILDDLHWADRSTLRLVCHLARYSDAAPLLIVGTYRDTELHASSELADALADLRREHLDQRLTLAGIDEDAVDELVVETTVAAPRGLSTILHQETRGNPFFVVEMLRHLTENAALRRGAAADAAQVVAEAGVPEGVRQVINRRLAGLSHHARDVLTTASVLGQEFDLGVLATVEQGAAGTDLEQRLQEGVDAGVVAEVAGTRERFGFSHALVRETLYSRLSSRRRAEVHRRVADVLEVLYERDRDGRAAELAHHLLAAGSHGDGARAVRYSIAASEQATARLAYEEAAGHLSRALATSGLTDERRCELLLALGEARWCSGELDGAREACLAAAHSARRLADPDCLARAALGYAGPLRFEPVARREQPLVELLEDAIAAFGSTEGSLRACVTARLAAVLLSAGEEERKRVLAAEAIAMARRAADKAALADVLATSLFATRGPDNLDERLATGRELADLADEVGEGRIEAVTRGGLLDDLLELGDGPASARELERFESLAESLGERYRRWLVALAKTRRALIEGRLEDCERTAQHSVTLGLGEADESAMMAFAAQVMFLRREQDRLDELVGGVEFMVERYPEVPSWRCGLAYVYAELDRIADARDELEMLGVGGFADLPRDAWWLVGMSMLADVAGAVDGGAHAERLYDLLVPFADRCVVATITCQGSVSRPLGVLASALGRYDAAARHFADAVAMNGRIGSPLWVARTRYDEAAMLLHRGAPGDRSRSRELASEARALAERHNLAALTRQVDRLTQDAASV